MTRRSQASDSSQPPPIAEPFGPRPSRRRCSPSARAPLEALGVREPGHVPAIAAIAPGTRKRAHGGEQPRAGPGLIGGDARAPANNSATS